MTNILQHPLRSKRMTVETYVSWKFRVTHNSGLQQQQDAQITVLSTFSCARHHLLPPCGELRGHGEKGRPSATGQMNPGRPELY